MTSQPSPARAGTNPSPRGVRLIKLGLGMALFAPIVLCYWHVVGKNLLVAQRMTQIPGVMHHAEIGNSCPGSRRSCATFETEFRYTFAGRPYTGTQPLLGWEWVSEGVTIEDGLHDVARRFSTREPAPLLVWVDPMQPEVSALENRVHKSVLVVANFALVAFWFLCFAPGNPVGIAVDWARGARPRRKSAPTRR